MQVFEGEGHPRVGKNKCWARVRKERVGRHVRHTVGGDTVVVIAIFVCFTGALITQ